MFEVRPQHAFGPAAGHRRRRWRSLRMRLAVLAFVASLPAAAVLGYAVLEERSGLAAAARTDALQLAELAALDHATSLASTRGLLVGLAQLPVLARPRRPDCHRFLAGLLAREQGYLNFGVVEDGKVVCSALPVKGPVDVSGEGYVKRALSTGRFAVGDYRVDGITGQPGVDAAVPLAAGAGEPRRLLFAALGLAPLADLASLTNMPAGTSVTLVDGRGVVVARRPAPEKWVGNDVSKRPAVRRALAERRGAIIGRLLDGEKGVIAFAPVAGATSGKAPAVALVGIPLAEVYGPATQTFHVALVALVVAALLLALGAWFVAERMLVKPLGALVGATRGIADGDLTVRTGHGRLPGELGELARSIDSLAESIEEERRRD